MTEVNQIKYNAPPGSPSSIGPQIRTDYYKKKALMEAAKEQYFGQLADVTNMPKHFGKTIKMYHYLPLLDDANINDQGIDAQGVIANGVDEGVVKVTIAITKGSIDETSTGNGYVTRYFIGENVDAGQALLNAQAATESFFTAEGVWNGTYAQTVADVTGGLAPWNTPATQWTVTENTAVPNTGNLYGSSKDIGYIQGKLPALSETGGRVNRVGFKRIELQGSIEKLGFFDEYTQESMDFDTDEELEMHINREMVMGANEITEDMLQIDLLNSAGVVRFGGDAISTVQISGDTGPGVNPSIIGYEDLQRMAIDLDDNRTPKQTKIITGSRMIDTKVIDSARVLYIGTELQYTIKTISDTFGNQAFIPVQSYAKAGGTLRGEIGAIDQWRIVVVPEMLHWAGVGAVVGASGQPNGGYRETNGRYDVYPMLSVGSGSFTTIGFQTDGKTVKFTITHKKPGRETANHNDPYGEIGFMSIKWYYGFMLMRPERIALAKVVAPY